MNISEFDKGWLVGFLEGEGSFSIIKSRNKPCLRIQVMSTEEESLRRLQKIIGGILNGPYQSSHKSTLRNTKNPKPYWQWALNRKDEVNIVCKILYPHLSSRRKRQIDRFNKIIEKNSV